MWKWSLYSVCLRFVESFIDQYVDYNFDIQPRHSSVCHLRRWADKFFLHHNIFNYIRHMWIKPVLCSRMVSLFHHTSPWTHRCLQLSPSAHRNGRVFRRSVQTACCYWILNRGKAPPIEIHRPMQAAYGDQCIDVSTIRRRVRRFKPGE